MDLQHLLDLATPALSYLATAGVSWLCAYLTHRPKADK